MKYNHRLISPPRVIDNIRIYGDLDIVAMKINAILGRGKKKDFWDMAELLRTYSLDDCIEAYEDKFPSQQLLISVPVPLSTSMMLKKMRIPSH